MPKTAPLRRLSFKPQTLDEIFWLKRLIRGLGINLHLIENTFDWKRIYANLSSYPNPNSNPNTNPNPNHNSNPNPNPNLKAQLCFRTDEMTSFFDQM